MDELIDDPEREGVDVAGPRDAQSIVFLHGTAFSRAQWAPQRDALAEEFHVVAPDLPGHGTRAGEPFHLGSAIDLLETVVRKGAGGHAVLVGLSLGGYVATAYTGRFPDRVDGLMLVGSSANPVESTAILTRLLSMATRVVTRSSLFERSVERLGKRWVRNRNLRPEHEAEILEAGLYPRQLGMAGPNLAGYDFRADLETYSGPVMIVNGESDRLMRKEAPAHAEAGGTDSQARVVTVDGSGHVCPLHRPSAVSDLVATFATRIETERTL